MKAKIKKALRNLYGDFNSLLEVEYEEKVTQNLLNENWGKKMEWATYNQIIFELKYSIKDEVKVKELQYWLTDKIDPKLVCIEIIKDVKNRSAELQRLYEKISTFNDSLHI